MAQSVTIAGITFPDVPSIEVPKSGGGTAAYVDISATTATASDVASGKLFYAADGTATTGTASGGSTTLVMGAIRPDATLVQEWTGDVKAVTDLRYTIPSFTSTALTVQATANLTPTITIDDANYDYYVVQYSLSAPIYSAATPVKGRMEFFIDAYVAEVITIPANIMKAGDGTTYTSKQVGIVTSNHRYQALYWKSASDLSGLNSSYGTYALCQAPDLSNGVLTIKRPELDLRGNANYLSSDAWAMMTDIRYQWVLRVYRAAKGNLNLDGWMREQMLMHAIGCRNNGGTLT